MIAYPATMRTCSRQSMREWARLDLFCFLDLKCAELQHYWAAKPGRVLDKLSAE